MKANIRVSATILAAAALLCAGDFADGRGRGGGGGGFRGGGGGGISRGGGGISRGGGGISRGGARPASRPAGGSPSFSRPQQRPTGGVRPGASSPGNFQRPAQRPTQRPGQQPGTRPGVSGGTPGTRPDIGGVRPGTRPDIGSTRPGTGTRPGVGTRPSTGTRPGFGTGAIVGAGAATLPGLIGNSGGLGDRGAVGDRVGQRQDLRQAGVADRGQFREQRSDNLQGRLEGRYDRQGQRQENLGDRQDSRRDDWYSHHNDWNNGHWHGGNLGWGSRWNYMWDNYPGMMALGVTSWGLNRIGYWWGYEDYSNPYYTGDSYAVNYSEPVLAEPPYDVPADDGTSLPAVTPSTEAQPLPPGVSQAGMESFEQAQAAFKSGSYDEALTAVDLALKEMPRDALVNEFRALVLFAQKDYKHAAETLYAVLAVGPGWDWTTLSGLYADVESYNTQLRALESYVKSNTQDAAGHFLLGYQYTCCGHKEAAGNQFKLALQINSEDTVSRMMLDTLGITPETEAKPPAADKKLPTIPLESLVGTWSAKRGAASFQMMLAEDKSFTWTYSEGAKKTVANGVFAVDGDALAMEPDAGGVMAAQIKLDGSTLQFKMMGDEKDPGLTFSK